MMTLPIGMVILLVVAVLIYFGLAHRVLDRMYLTDRGALIFIVLMIAASFFNITIVRTPPRLIVNVGGALFPLGLIIYLEWRADTAVEKVRGLLSAVITAAVVWVAARLMPAEPTRTVIDPTYLFAIVGGLVAYIAGRSRRSAFIAGSLGIILADLAHYVEITIRGLPGRTWLGGAGAFDSVIIAGVLGTFLAEVIGETREAIQGGPKDDKRRPIKNVEFTGMLSDVEEDDLVDAERRGVPGQSGGPRRNGPVGETADVIDGDLDREPVGRGGSDELKDIDDYIDEYVGPGGLNSVHHSGGPGRPAGRGAGAGAGSSREEREMIRRAKEEADRRG